MKRSEINSAIKWAENLLETKNVSLPWFGKIIPEFLKEKELNA